MNIPPELKSKTMWFSIALAALGAVEIQIQIIPQEYRGHALILIASLTAALRYLTTKPLNQK